MENYTQENGQCKQVSSTDEGSRFGRMEVSMKVIGSTVKHKEEDD